MESREQARLIFPGAKVYIKRVNGFKLFKRTSKLIQLKDITLNGACFCGDTSYEEGELIALQIVEKDGEEIIINGQIIWTSYVEQVHTFYIGIEFLPFGIGERHYNSVHSLMRLNSMLEKNTLPPPHSGFNRNQS